MMLGAFKNSTYYCAIPGHAKRFYIQTSERAIRAEHRQDWPDHPRLAGGCVIYRRRFRFQQLDLALFRPGARRRLYAF